MLHPAIVEVILANLVKLLIEHNPSFFLIITNLTGHYKTVL